MANLLGWPRCQNNNIGVPVAGAPYVLPEGLESVHSLPDRRFLLLVRREHRLCFVKRHEYESLSAPILMWDGTG